VWDATSAFGLKNFAGASEAPILAVAAALQHLGVPSGIWEKLLFFWPVAILSFVMPWLLARELLDRSVWALMAPLIFAGNTYFLLIETGHLTVAVAETLAFAVLLAFVRSIQRGSVRWSVLAGLLFGLQATYEIRIAYITLLAALLYLILKMVSDVGGKVSMRRIGLGVLTMVTFAGSQAYWWLPFLTYRGDRGIPTAASPWLAFMQLSHGITGVHPFWTGAAPTAFRTTDLNPLYFLVPVVAFGAFLARRIPTEMLWLGLVALVAGFLIKQQNPPGGQIYDWMFSNVPGWSAFREASKLFLLVALAFCVLVPFAFRTFLKAGVAFPLGRNLVGAAAIIALIGLESVAFVPLLKGQLGGTTRATEAPPSFVALASMLQSDPRYSPVLWMGGPSLNEGAHIFPIASQRHPLVVLKGTADAGDVLANFCLPDSIPFCYLDEELFHFLVARTGAGYVVAPIAKSVGDLPVGTSRGWIRSKLTAILGSPLVSSDATLAVWRLDVNGVSVTQASATAVVDAARETTIAALPALEALAIPTVFQSGLSALPLPVDVPSAVHVLPRLSEGCRSPKVGTFSVFARSAARSLDLSRSGELLRLPLLATPRVPADWAVYGPVTLDAGFNSLIPLNAAALGPCMEWSRLAASLLRSPSNVSLTNVVTSAERVSAAAANPDDPWIELMRSFDPGWTLPGAHMHLLGDGLFNLYYVGTVEHGTGASRGVLTFSFESHSSEIAGLLMSLIAIAAALLLILLSSGSRNNQSSGRGIAIERPALSTVARQLALAGVLLLVIAAGVQAITWFALHPALKGISIINDPYGADHFYIAAAMALLLVSMVLRLPGADRQAATDGRRTSQ
jgi:hypothetical protein